MTNKMLDEILAGYCPNKTLRERWAKLLRERAMRFYVEGELDDIVAQEDLYKEDGKYVNLDHSEKYERDYKFC